jgi:hypothetical protein
MASETYDIGTFMCHPNEVKFFIPVLRHNEPGSSDVSSETPPQAHPKGTVRRTWPVCRTM